MKTLTMIFAAAVTLMAATSYADADMVPRPCSKTYQDQTTLRHSDTAFRENVSSHNSKAGSQAGSVKIGY